MAQTRIKVYGHIVDISTPGGQVAHQILRQCELMDQAGELINTSKTVSSSVQCMTTGFSRSLVP